jgi:ABC-type Na+ transport system ATPase subunit NatA/pimeloyl-ACP methyl ester carboxylesterase
MSGPGRRWLAAAAASAACLAGPALAADAAPGALRDCHIAGFRNGVLAEACNARSIPGTPRGARSTSSTWSSRPWRGASSPTRCSSSPAAPGQSAISLAPQAMALLARLNNRRDIVFVDQRGTGRSAPLACKDPEDETLAEQAEPERQQRMVAECKASLLKQPWLKAESDLGFFTTTIAVQDLDAVRRRLGAERIDLVGGSYGTRVALEVLRQFPATVRRTVIDGVAPADMALPASSSTDNQAALDRLIEACAAEPACARAHPDLRARLVALLQGLPREVKALHPLTGIEETFTLTRELVLGAIRGALYAPALAAALPEAIEAAARGDYAGLIGLSATQGSGKALRLATACTCRWSAPRTCRASPRGRQAGQRVRHRLRRHVREGLRHLAARRGPGRVLFAAQGPFGDAGPERRPRPATPPRHGERVAKALGPLARHLVVPNAGHGVMSIGCMRDVIFRFVDAASDAEALAVDASASPRCRGRPRSCPCARPMPRRRSPADDRGQRRRPIVRRRRVRQARARRLDRDRREARRAADRPCGARRQLQRAGRPHHGLLGPTAPARRRPCACSPDLITPEAGKLAVDGIDVVERPREVLARMGVLSDSRGLYPRLTARENIVYYGALQGMERDAADARGQDLARMFDMTALLDRRTEGFSQGERMKTALARALVHDPPNIVLDEPTNGLDVLATRALRESLRWLRTPAGGGKCIVFSTHIMQEVERLCDSVVVVAEGRTVATGTVRRAAGTDRAARLRGGLRPPRLPVGAGDADAGRRMKRSLAAVLAVLRKELTDALRDRPHPGHRAGVLGPARAARAARRLGPGRLARDARRDARDLRRRRRRRADPEELSRAADLHGEGAARGLRGAAAQGDVHRSGGGGAEGLRERAGARRRAGRRDRLRQRQPALGGGDGTDRAAAQCASAASAPCSTWRCAASRCRCSSRCASTSAISPISRRGRRGITGMIPYFVMMAVLYGALTAALDTTAGERERGSLEPLLMNPTERWALVVGKWGAVACVSMLIAVLSSFSFLPASGCCAATRWRRCSSTGRARPCSSWPCCCLSPPRCRRC